MATEKAPPISRRVQNYAGDWVSRKLSKCGVSTRRPTRRGSRPLSFAARRLSPLLADQGCALRACAVPSLVQHAPRGEDHGAMEGTAFLYAQAPDAGAASAPELTKGSSVSRTDAMSPWGGASQMS